MMFRLGAIMTVAAAAAPWSSEEASEQGSGERELLRGAAEKRLLRRGGFRKQKLRAYINDNGSRINVEVTQEEPGKAKWEITVHKLPNSVTNPSGACAGGLKWHVHELPLGDTNRGKGHGTSEVNGSTGAPLSAPECVTTSGHWDPFFACGAASQHKGDLCKRTGRTGGVGYLCSTTDQNLCEMGDLKGKMGFVKVDQLGMKQTFYDDANVQALSEFKDRSIVFHCDSPRVACSNFY